VKLVGIMFYLVHHVENNFVKTTFAVTFMGGKMKFPRGILTPPGNGLE